MNKCRESERVHNSPGPLIHRQIGFRQTRCIAKVHWHTKLSKSQWTTFSRLWFAAIQRIEAQFVNEDKQVRGTKSDRLRCELEPSGVI